ncbi:carbohydrate ABC transporter permease [Paenibacillus beijingensis]|uniref:Sugar ABC transporter permease n=1 Tax=Paenibacillus beijingensis TaxID=1126833 RepID=A0A0D5NPY3_9BACL|nr:sugar ABC transporter permease [Paenibacillus beijingensis]AJY77316.1 sugar ABC transporter permease [Paenibacillus beijingensis]
MTRNDRKAALLFFAPAAVFMVLFFLYPMALLIRDSVFDSKTGTRFVGGDNYVNALTSERFYLSLYNTVIFVIGAVTIELLIGLVLALLLATGFKGSQLTRTLFLSPLMIAPLVCGLIWKFMLNDQFGIINSILYRLGILNSPHSILWLSDSKFALFSCMIADVWLTTPFMMLVLLAGIQGIPGSLYEAAHIDGAGRSQRFWHITLPSLKPVIVVAVLIRMIDAARSFDIIWILTQGGPGFSSSVLSTMIYNAMARYNQTGYASALAVLFMLAMLLVCGFFMNRVWNPGKKEV